jgi:hypothetical protein
VVELGLLPESAITGKFSDASETGTSTSLASTTSKATRSPVEAVMMASPKLYFNPLRRRKKDWNEILRLSSSNTMNYVE